MRNRENIRNIVRIEEGTCSVPLFINSNPLQLHSIYSSEFLPMKQRLEESCLESASFNIARQFEKLSSFFIDYDTVLFDFMF